MLKILCFGDSITLGEKDIERGGWADRLKTHYFRQFVDNQTQEITLYNLGVAGETTDGLSQRFDTELKARSIKGQASLLVLAYGANDIVIHKNKNIVPEAYFVRNLKQCIESAKNIKAQIILLNLLPISDSIEGKVNQHGKLRFDHDVQAYNDILKTLSKEMKCEYLDVYTFFIELNKEDYLSSDGVHPNSKGHELLFQKLKQKISNIIS